MGGLVAPVGLAPYCSTKFALEGIAEALSNELAPYGIKVQTINPGGYFTGFNERVGETGYRWLDDSKNFTKHADLTAQLDLLIGNDSGRLEDLYSLLKTNVEMRCTLRRSIKLVSVTD